MAIFINTNTASINAQRNLSTSQSSLTTSLQRLSSGLRINSAKDDAAGLAISERLTSQIRGSDQASRNANDGISLAQTAEGDLAQIGTNLQRVRELAVQSSNASNSASDRASLQNESSQLLQEIDRIATTSSFNGNKLLDGSFTSQTFQVGANNTANDRVSINAISSARITDLGGVGSTTSASTAGSGTLTALVAGDLTLNGLQVGASSNGALPGQTADSAFQIAAAINKVSPDSGVTATANAATVTGGTGATATAVAAGSFAVNGIDVGAIASGGNAVGQGANTAAAINKISSQTGVVASADAVTGAVKLTAADGRNIALTQKSPGGTAYTTLATDTGLSPAVTNGTVSLSSTSASGVVISGGNASRAGFSAQTVAATTVSSVSSIGSMNLSTAAGAVSALDAIDGALATVNSARASLGAYQNRFESVVSNLQTKSESLTASRSRIQDTDFAKETASLTRGQILQQAGTAMLAQANSLPNGVLSLLRG